jgi:hypothetical protein
VLAGLIFATDDADDRPDALAATLPFGGMTLIEYQARLLASVGVSHLMIAVSRVTPALLGAVSRIGARGVAVDIVRSAGESAAKVHPLAQVIVVADGLVTTDAVIEWVAAESHEAMLVTRDGDGVPGGERVDAAHFWAGLARVPASRIADVAAMPEDYDFQSTLLRQASQAGAIQLVLPAATARTRHGVERSAAALLRRSKSVLAALSDRRTAWIDRFLFTPITAWTLPQLVARAVPGWALMLGAGVIGAAALALFYWLRPAAGLAMTLVLTALLSTGSMLSWLRGEDRAARFQERGIVGAAAVAMLLTGAASVRLTYEYTGFALALFAIGLGALVERTTVPRQRWWATPASAPLVLMPFAAAGYLTTGLAVVVVYAFATLAMAIEATRKAE